MEAKEILRWLRYLKLVERVGRSKYGDGFGSEGCLRGKSLDMIEFHSLR